jgi:N-acetyl-1-D-myo-inositol-2-amino-2-deoxy-alpha-D-glucopyranoside deacetylase
VAARERTGGLLAVHAHPDDETLSTGGLLAAWARSTRPVMVVTCTRGEQGEVIPAELARLEGDALALAARREIELADALAALGIADHSYLDQLAEPPGQGFVDTTGPGHAVYRDSGMAWLTPGRAGRGAELPPDAFVSVPIDEAARRLAALIRGRRPDVVVTYEPGGGYGHPDHVHAHLVTMRAVELAAGEGGGADGLAGGADGLAGGPEGALPAFRVPLVLWAVQPESTIRSALSVFPGLPWVQALLEANRELTVFSPTDPLPSMAVPQAWLDYVVDTSGVTPEVVGALRAHLTQVQAVTVASEGPSPVQGAAITGCFALCNQAVTPLFDREWYRAATSWRRAAVANLVPLTPQVP